MKIVMITGSAHKNGTTAVLAEEFVKGAVEAGHEVFRFDAALHKNKKAALMVTMADDTEKTADGAVASFKGTADFLEWEIAGTVIGVNCGTVEDLKKTDYPKQAYELGKSF